MTISMLTNTSLSPVGTNSVVKTGRSPGFSFIGHCSLPDSLQTSGFLAIPQLSQWRDRAGFSTGFPIKLRRYPKHLFPLFNYIESRYHTSSN
ncbi:hypothetical protein ABD86_15050 [Paenibacillus alvei]|nr:hypothetical protein [Paenibacillus alvei]MBG9745178.1 hypothetical protein [Paenibacillus alvei]